MKNKASNKLDQFILQLAVEFAKIPDFDKKMEDADLRKIHTFISVGILGLHDAINLVTVSFIPAAAKMVANTRGMIQHSMFKHILSTINYDPNTTQHETIRLGYVFVFHKFEVFVNQLMEIMDETSGEPAMALKKYCKSKFDFSPTDWFRNTSVHLVNFISNCTKHQDGLCRLNNSAYSKPAEFETHSPDEKIVRSTQQFRADTKALIDEILPLINAINGIFMYRAVDSSVTTLSDGPINSGESALLETAKGTMETLARINIAKYQQ